MLKDKKPLLERPAQLVRTARPAFTLYIVYLAGLALVGSTLTLGDYANMLSVVLPPFR